MSESLVGLSELQESASALIRKQRWRDQAHMASPITSLTAFSLSLIEVELKAFSVTYKNGSALERQRLLASWQKASWNTEHALVCFERMINGEV